MIGRVAMPSSTVSANAVRSDGPYGPLQPADANGLRLPSGFTSRLVARSGDPVGDTGLQWHAAPDGGACFPTDGGFVYVSNSEVDNGAGGVSAISFDHDSNIVDAYSILSGTRRNCSGGVTPWGTWLSCEEVSNGYVHECDPLGIETAQLRPKLGTFMHEAAVFVPATPRLDASIIMTEDDPVGRLYRFVPDDAQDLRSGRLYAAHVDPDGVVTWEVVSAGHRNRSSKTTPFNGGEGLAVLGTDVFIATKGDRRLWRLDMATSTIEVIHDCIAAPDTVLDSVDGLVIDEPTGDLFVAEDGATSDLAVVSASASGELEISPFVQIMGHAGSEVTGLAIDPNRTTMFVSSQRGSDGRGMTFAVTGPFRTADQPPNTTTTSTSTTSTSPTSTTPTSTTSTSTTPTTTSPSPTSTSEPPPDTTSTTTGTTSTSSTSTSSTSTSTVPPDTTSTTSTAPSIGSKVNRALNSSTLRRAERMSADESGQ